MGTHPLRVHVWTVTREMPIALLSFAGPPYVKTAALTLFISIVK